MLRGFFEGLPTAKVGRPPRARSEGSEGAGALSPSIGRGEAETRSEKPWGWGPAGIDERGDRALKMLRRSTFPGLAQAELYIGVQVEARRLASLVLQIAGRRDHRGVVRRKLDTGE